MSTMTNEIFDRIWLEPREGCDPYIGRQWCQDNQWGEDGIEYVRADLAPAPQEHAELSDRIMRLLDDHDRCPPQARDYSRRRGTAILIMQAIRQADATPPSQTNMEVPEDVQNLARSLLRDMDADFGKSPNKAYRDACDIIACALLAERERAAPSPHLVALESDPATLRGYCQQLLDMFENYGVYIEGEDNDLIAHISKAVDPAHVEPDDTTEARADA